MGFFDRSGLAPLPEYVVVVSDRARRVRLTVRAGEPVRVTVPRGFPVRRAAGFVAGSLPWIARTRERVERRAAVLRERAGEPLPDVVELPGIGLRAEVVYRRTGARGVRAIERTRGTVTVEGCVSDETACKAALCRWVLATARRELPALAWRVAGDVGCAPRSIAVTWPRRRWGSCSASGDIRLSAALLFLPPVDVRATVIHEFAHLAVLDHSPRFHAEVGRLDPAAAHRRARTPHQEESTPGWALRQG